MEELQPLVQAIERLGYRVTVGDVAAQSGLRVALVEHQLLQLAAASQATLQVSDRGDIAFQFPHNLRQRLQQESWRQQLQLLRQQLWRLLFYLIRISFGLGLLLSIGLFVVAIIAIVVALSEGGDIGGGGGGDSSGGSGSSGSSALSWGGDWWPWLTFDGPSHPNSERRSLNFLEAIFSFLFGDGDPNADREQRRWQLMGAYIRSQQGAVVAEQLQPYLDRPLDSSESDLLPVLVRFDGQPRVSERGQLIYQFPALQVTASAADARSRVARSLQERLWSFSQASRGQILGAIALGVVNLVLAAVFGGLLLLPGVASLGGIVAVVAGLYRFLLVYAIGFLAVPALRWLWIQRQNQKIRRRNRDRQSWADRLRKPSLALGEKLMQLAPWRTQAKIDADKLIYSGDRDLLDQEFAQDSAIAAEWQTRLMQTDPEEP
ncbi:hypothetical protein [Synechococcus elongatus]|uniref:hypothetical protein n=1 Tax=Synechococcus elongatus TaxID=32046 RepID=UPI000F7D815C|nr:hypothetical protein [Synechococcus elongatus]